MSTNNIKGNLEKYMKISELIKIKENEKYHVLLELGKIYSKRNIDPKIYGGENKGLLIKFIISVYSSYLDYDEIHELIENERQKNNNNDNMVFNSLCCDMIDKISIEIDNYVDKYTDIEISENAPNYAKFIISDDYDPVKYMKKKMNKKFVLKKMPKRLNGWDNI